MKLDPSKLWTTESLERFGTVRWFGEPWGAPVCIPECQVEAPVEELCGACWKIILTTDSGLVLPFYDQNGLKALPYHRDCFSETITRNL